MIAALNSGLKEFDNFIKDVDEASVIFFFNLKIKFFF